MENFITFMDKHGETGVQALLDNWEKYEDIRYVTPLTLEQRWSIFIYETGLSVEAAA